MPLSRIAWLATVAICLVTCVLLLTMGVVAVYQLGSAQDRGGVFSFTMQGAHAHDIATLLDRAGIAVRAGNHCAEPLMRRLGVDSTARASAGRRSSVRASRVRRDDRRS